MRVGRERPRAVITAGLWHCSAQYAWYNQNSRERAWPCGRLQPNELGLFDMLGNVYEWCQDQYGPYPTGGNDTVSDNINILSSINERSSHLLRGVAFSDPAVSVRVAYRFWDAPSDRYISYGFRPARDLPLIHCGHPGSPDSIPPDARVPGDLLEAAAEREGQVAPSRAGASATRFLSAADRS